MINLNKTFLYYLKKYFRSIIFINKVSGQLKKKDIGKIILFRFFTDSILIFLKNIIVYKKINKDFYQYTNKFKFTFNWFGFNAQIWFYLFKKFKLFNKKINILEIGTFEGMSTAYFLRYLKKSNLDAVDKLDKKSIHFKNFLFNKKKLKKFRYFNILSNKFFKKNKKKNYDLIYIDGSHYYKDVLNDALNSYKILNKDGIIIFDDLLYTRESRNKKNKEFTNTLGGIIIFLSKIKNYKIIYSGHQFVIQKK